MSKVLVTGGAGFIGSHLVDRLVSLNHEVTVIDDLSTGNEDNVNAKAHFLKYTIGTNLASLLIQEERFDVVFHLAAQINLRDSFMDPVHDARTNVMGSLKLIEGAVKSGSKMIFSSTGGAIYSPRSSVPWSENDPAIPESPYGVSKLAVEHYLRVLTTNSAILRLANVYGPRQNPKGEAGVISIFLDRMLQDQPIKIFGDGFQTRDFVYVDDVVDAFMLAMVNDITGIYNVSTCDRVDINKIAELLKRMTSKNNLLIEYAPPIEGELKHSALNYHKIKGMWGWRPKTALYDGLKKTVAYYL